LGIEIEPQLSQLNGDVPGNAVLVQGAQDLYVAIPALARLLRCGDVFAKMVQDDRLAGVRKRSDGPERFVEPFSGDESSSEAILRAQVPDPIRYRLLCREPEDEIAERIRIIRLFI
jgi:hypothetical protein